MRGAAFTAVLLLAACSSQQTFVEPEGGWQRMMEQPRYTPFGESRFFADGRVMQAPPAGTVSRDAPTAGPDVTRGYTDQGYVDRIPVPVDTALLARGRDRFEVFCAPCHGMRGDAQSVVGNNMPLVPPRNLLLPQIRAYPPGRIFRVTTEGFGLMAPYDVQLTVRDRWAVVAYVRALQLSQGVALGDLPPDLQAKAREALR